MILSLRIGLRNRRIPTGAPQGKVNIKWILRADLESVQVSQGYAFQCMLKCVLLHRGNEHDFDGADASLDENGLDGIGTYPEEQGHAGRSGCGGQG